MYGRAQRPKLHSLESVSALVPLYLSTKGHKPLESPGEITSQTGRQSLSCSVSSVWQPDAKRPDKHGKRKSSEKPLPLVRQSGAASPAVDPVLPLCCTVNSLISFSDKD